MKRNSDDIIRLIAELKNDQSQLLQLFETNTRAMERIHSGARDYLDFAALGYTIHNIYSVIENACLRIAKFFENNLSESSWHKELLERMRLDIPELRPAFFSEPVYLLVDDLRSFRHVFRNLYAKPIDQDKILLVQKKVPQCITEVSKAVDAYALFLSELRKDIS